MNKRNLDERIFMGKFAIVLFRIVYILAIIISIALLIDGSYKEGIIYGGLAVVAIILNIFIKYHEKKRLTIYA